MGFRAKLESALTSFNTFWMFATLSLGLGLLVLFAILVVLTKLIRLMKRSAAEPGN
jgi:hypothetical protein